MLKKPPLADLPDEERPEIFQCPECGEPLHNMGKEFAPPPRRNLKVWREIEQRHREIQAASHTLGRNPR
jgi:transcription initiation factor IIE alpha subunit